MKHINEENETSLRESGLPESEEFELAETQILEEEKLSKEELLEAEFEEEDREEEEIAGRTLSPTRLVLKRFFRSKLSMTGLVILLALFIFSFLGPVFRFLPFVWGEKEADESYAVKEEYSTEVKTPEYGSDPVYIVTYSYPTNYLKPSSTHLLGTDDKGFDVSDVRRTRFADRRIRRRHSGDDPRRSARRYRRLLRQLGGSGDHAYRRYFQLRADIADDDDRRCRTGSQEHFRSGKTVYHDGDADLLRLGGYRASRTRTDPFPS